MARWAHRWGFALRSCAGAVLVASVGVAGCNKHDEPDASPTPAETASATEPKKDATPAADAKGPTAPGAFGNDDRLHQPFAKAVFRDNDLPPESNRPPDDTIAGKPTYALLRQVKELWETIRFITTDGKAIEYTAVIETNLGEFEIALRPDAAPNHVRSFIALAQAGFYNGLLFDRVRAEEPDSTADTPGTRLEQIEAGNPRGALEEINGSIGYWLHVEPSKLTHEEGTVGACLEGGAESDGCRFYVTLSKAPYLDGNFTAFGNVRTGLDVARKIFAQPVVNEDRERDGLRRPEKPVIIKKVTIHTRSAGATEGTK